MLFTLISPPSISAIEPRPEWRSSRNDERRGKEIFQEIESNQPAPTDEFRLMNCIETLVVDLHREKSASIYRPKAQAVQEWWRCVLCRSCFHHSTLYLGNIFERHRTKINIQKIATCAALVHWVKEEVHHGKISQKLFRLFRAVNKWKVAFKGETQLTSTQCDLRDALVVRVAQFPAAHPSCKSIPSSIMSEYIALSLSAVSSNLRIADCWWYYRVISQENSFFVRSEAFLPFSFNWNPITQNKLRFLLCATIVAFISEMCILGLIWRNVERML